MFFTPKMWLAYLMPMFGVLAQGYDVILIFGKHGRLTGVRSPKYDNQSSELDVPIAFSVRKTLSGSRLLEPATAEHLYQATIYTRLLLIIICLSVIQIPAFA
ncbi:uncharacterized protein FFB20_09721 [Fusarium fujikuroi]|nr:uncharacterized protein FFE2_04994 [Fusarium fujikuroi]SCN84676.1 uncharacterized protein FFC1_04648 [Fusarium fujikuroi]SCN84793.1 uncharacterized protein FFM5_03484 [Fusarium fujikuroi]SCN94368.1 uncharacterized protein FFB20_09721 [Fusarium fujikuroi]SCO34473.1 uncharacterized protein FFNC_03853 [Fusarium fujikuroi]